jgi:hypothetical protein
MLWSTKSHLHLDRVATPWLIKRFVDPEAEFRFVDGLESVPLSEREYAFGMPLVTLSSHDERGTAFHKVLEKFELDDPALVLMERVIASGVADALGTAPPANQTDEEAIIGAALNRLGIGLGVAFDDPDHLRVGLGLYEGLYALCKVRALPDSVGDEAPADLGDRIAYLRSATGMLVAPAPQEA